MEQILVTVDDSQSVEKICEAIKMLPGVVAVSKVKKPVVKQQ